MRPDPALALERNAGALFACFARWRLVESHGGEGLRAVATPVPLVFFNGVRCTDLADADADAAIADALAWLRRQRVPWTWWVGPGARPHDLPRRLEAAGLFGSRGPLGMARALDAPLETPPRAGLQIDLVDDAAARDWHQVSMRAFDVYGADARAMLALYRDLGFAPDAPLRHYLARLDGQPAGVASLVLDGAVAGLYSVGTLPELRRRGVATALTARILEGARALGCRLAVLQASGFGQAVYAKLGFEPVGRITTFWSRS